MTDHESHTKGSLQATDFFSTGPCRQRRPGMPFKDKRRCPVTVCNECPGVMLVGTCLRDRVLKALVRSDQ